MRNPREELQLVDGVLQSLAVLRLRAEMLPEGHDVRISVEVYLHALERKVQDEVDELRKSVEGEYRP